MKHIVIATILMIGLLLSAIIFCSEKSSTEPTPVEIKPIAAFEIESIDKIAPVAVSFVNKSKNCISYQWDFGNGVKSTDENPSQTFEIAGNYEVKLVVSGDHGIDSTKKVLELIDPPATIILDKEAAGIKLKEDDIAKVISVHGKDYDERINAVASKVRWIIQYQANGLTFWTKQASDQNQRSAVKISRIKIEAPYKGVTDRGIGIGSSRSDVETAYAEGSYYNAAVRSFYRVGSSGIHLDNSDIVDYIYVGEL
jgi:hypothetical protein